MPRMLALDYALPVCSLAVHVSNVSACSCRRSWPHIPVVSIPEDLTVKIALSLKYEINRSLAVLREIALGRDLKKFLAVIAGLLVISIVGNCTNFLTFFYIVFITLHTVPFLYDKHEDQVDAFGEKAAAKFKKHYAVVHAKYLSKIPKGPLKDKKIPVRQKKRWYRMVS
ncbi:reticulon-like protein B2 [Zingiber officinale]|uniref:reticulon-like protein B2 n=1 Tax=Zingiber officinale TaxID=94328 RepID=UPI001C4B1C66|nr:reticulon-like protein B2 [Zingiber officinale]